MNSLWISLILVLIAFYACRSSVDAYGKVKTLRASGKRVFVVGDIHGQWKKLESLLNKAKLLSKGVIKSDAELICAGDMISKTSHDDTMATFKYLMKIKARAVKGNWESQAIQNGRSWFKKFPEGKKWMEALPDAYEITSHGKAIVAHGGLDPKQKTLRKQSGSNLRAIRNWADKYSSGPFVYFGHHQSTKRVKKFSKAICLDTGCYNKGALTGIFVGSDGKPSGKLLTVCCSGSCTVKECDGYRYKNCKTIKQ